MKKLLFLLIVGCLFSCSKSNQDIISLRHWKFSGGDYPLLGDWFSGDEVRISGDTIYIDKPIAKIVSTDYHYDHYQLEVVSLINEKRAIYVDKGRVD
jgi:hypothetical protein